MTRICRSAFAQSLVGLALVALNSVNAVPVLALDLNEQQELTNQLELAWKLLNSDPERALHIFISQLPLWSSFSRQSPGYIDADRGSLISAVFAGSQANASIAWQRIMAESRDGVVAEREPIGDSLAWRQEWVPAFRAYRSEGRFGVVPSTQLINDGLDLAIKRNNAGAIARWSLPASGSGPSDLSDVQLCLIGLAQASDGRWREARQTWIRAARQGRVVPQIDALYAGNIMALSMIYHLQDYMRPV